MTQTEEAERLQKRMQRIRRRLDTDVDELLTDAQQLLSWKYYLLRHPIASMVGISAITYFLIPTKRPVAVNKVYLDPEASRELMKKTDSVSSEIPEEAAKQGFILSLASLAVNSLIRTGLSYAVQSCKASLLKDYLSPGAPMKGRT